MPNPIRPIAALSLLAGTFAALAAAASAEPPPARAWEIGPVIKGRNYSVNMPLRPQPTRDGPGFGFPSVPDDFGHVHYVTYNPGSLRGAREITIRFRIDAPAGTRFIPQEAPSKTAYLSLFFQRRGDSWTAKGPYEHFRWYSPHETLVPLRPGTFEVTMPLDDRWHSVRFERSGEHPREFRAALEDTMRVGFVMGHKHGRGHGVYATRPARFTLLDFEIN